MKNHDGWTLKVDWLDPSKPYLIPGYFHYTRLGVIKAFEGKMVGRWEKYRRKGHHKIVKVKMIEVNND